MPPNYQNAKIYKIYSYENDDVYYGSTVETLSQRMTKHRSNFKQYKNGNIKTSYVTSFKILDFESSKIELVENYSCNSKEELLQREGYYIRNNNCVNKLIAGRTEKMKKEYIKEWRVENKNHIKEQVKEYFDKNKPYFKEKQKEYYELNKQQILEQIKEYRNANRDEINKKKRERYALKKQQLMLKEDTNINI